MPNNKKKGGNIKKTLIQYFLKKITKGEKYKSSKIICASKSKHIN